MKALPGVTTCVALGVLTAFTATPVKAYCDRPSYFHIPGSMIQWDAPYDCNWRHTEFAPDARPLYRVAPHRGSRAYASSRRCRMTAEGARVCHRLSR